LRPQWPFFCPWLCGGCNKHQSMYGWPHLPCMPSQWIELTSHQASSEAVSKQKTLSQIKEWKRKADNLPIYYACRRSI
jgi:hypothetical protein